MVATKEKYPCVLLMKLHDGRGTWWYEVRKFNTEEDHDKFIMNGMREGYDVDDWEDYFEYLNRENNQENGASI